MLPLTYISTLVLKTPIFQSWANRAITHLSQEEPTKYNMLTKFSHLVSIYLYCKMFNYTVRRKFWSLCATVSAAYVVSRERAGLTHKELEDSIATFKNHITSLQSQLAQREQQLKQGEEQLKEHKSILANQEQQYEEQLKEHKSILVNQEQQYKEQLEELAKTSKISVEVLEERTKLNKKFEENLSTQDRHIKAQEEQLAALKEQIEESKKTLANHEEQMTKEKAEIAQYKTELMQLVFQTLQQNPARPPERCYSTSVLPV